MLLHQYTKLLCMLTWEALPQVPLLELGRGTSHTTLHVQLELDGHSDSDSDSEAENEGERYDRNGISANSGTVSVSCEW